MALRSVISSRIPMVIILGATGTGKTKLSIELAQKYNTEIISADSMQVYKGLDVVNAKASRQEQELAKHHLLDILEPHQNFTVVDFRNRALKIIENLTEQGKIPIIVGGTNYYIESIVYQILVEDMDDNEALLWDKSRRKRDEDYMDNEIKITNEKVHAELEINDPETKGKRKRDIDDDVNTTEPEQKKTATVSNKYEKEDENPISELDVVTNVIMENEEIITKEKLQEVLDNERNFTNEEIHGKLKAIDPAMASRLHPNNRRKVLRSIEVWLKTGRHHSKILEEQKQREGQLRKPGRTIILWLRCEQSVHDERLNARVDEMLKNGLIEELLNFHDRHNKQRIKDDNPPDYTKGVFQTLGFKEFHDYLMMTEEQRNSEEGNKLLQQSIDNMKLGTRRYARRQNKMVRGRFLEHHNREIPPIFELDTTDITKWDELVKNKAIHIIESFLNESPCQYEPLKSNKKLEKKFNACSSNYCEVCQRLIIGDKEYEIHLKSNRHLKVMKKKKKLAQETLQK